MRKKSVVVLVLVALVLIGTVAGATQWVMTPLEEAVAKIEPAVGVLYRLVNVTNEKGEFVRNYYANGGTLTVIASNDTVSCLAAVAHSTVKKDEAVRPPETVAGVTYRHIFSGSYFASFDGENMFEVTLVAKRGDFPNPDDFALFRVANGKMPPVTLGDERMVRLGTEIFTISSPAVVPGGLIGVFTKGYVARHIDRKLPVTGSGLPQIRQLFILDIRITNGSSGAFVYVPRGNTAYAFGMIQGYFVAGTPTQQIGSNYPYALGISAFKQFLREEKAIERCLAQ